MKITLVTAFSLCAFVAFVKAKSLAGLGEEAEDLKDELNELEAMEIQDAPMGSPQPIAPYIYEALIKCFMDKNHGIMNNKCIQEFNRLLPADMSRLNKASLIKCIVRSFKKCTKPKNHKSWQCMFLWNDCVENAQEGSGWF